MIYAMLLAVIYVTATALSSLSVFACDHDHLHHHAAEGHHDTHSCHCCAHSNSADEAYSCDHHHDLLGDNLTEYITHGERNTLRSDDTSAHITDYATIEVATIDLSVATLHITARDKGYESTPLRAAYVAHKSLRAPPYWV